MSEAINPFPRLVVCGRCGEPCPQGDHVCAPSLSDYEAEADDAIRRSLRELGLSDDEIERTQGNEERVLAAWRELWAEKKEQPQVKEIARHLGLSEHQVKRANYQLLDAGLLLNPGKGRWIPAPRGK